MILVDTLVWIDHLRHHEVQRVGLLQQNLVLMHPMILGELACGNLNNRNELIVLWQGLPRIKMATDSEVMYFIDTHRFARPQSERIARIGWAKGDNESGALGYVATGCPVPILPDSAPPYSRFAG